APGPTFSTMRSIPEELTGLISDLELYLADGLKGENLSKKAKEKREAFIKRIKEVKLSFPQDFKDRADAEDSDEDDDGDSNEGGSLQSERTDKDEEACEGAQQAPAVAAQDLTSVFKAGYLEKRRKDHSFFGTEWQKRWCALSHQTFYYYGSEKDKQQKGEFSIEGYGVKMNSGLRKDSKKDFCFEISAPDKRSYMFCASSLKEAEEWVKQIDFVLRDMTGIIPEEEEEEHELYDDVGQMDEIYEVLPEEDAPNPPPKKAEPVSKHSSPPPAAVDKSTDYANYYQGLWDCTGDLPDELSFKRGDTIYILSKEYQTFGWWVGEMNGQIGIVPKSYLMELYAL
uniref:Src kinase-associated phosphoprotein 2 n=1 Tax=Tetraodon nigroviridis TaxID=99883 RepID=H3DM48_TETNG